MASFVASVRAPAVAGQFYPADAAELTRVVDSTVATAPVSDVDPVAVIAPHAAYRWSAPVAATAHVALARRTAPIDRVIVAGPTHQKAVKGIGVSSAGTFTTPLGDMKIDTDAVGAIRDLPGVVVADKSHDREYSLEVHLPFIQRLLDDVPIVPLVVGAGTPPYVTADVFERLWRDPGTVFVASSDLSHHHQIDRARSIDDSTSRLIEELDIHSISPERMCGAGAVRGLMKAALRRHLRVHTLDVRNSGDFGADPGRVVGYGAYAFSMDPEVPLADDSAARLLDLANAAARHRITEGRPVDADFTDLPEQLAARGAAFVSVSVGGVVRGCIGRIEPTDPLAETVAWAAGAAVEGRAWFTAIPETELNDVAVEIHLLSAQRRIFVSSADELAGSLHPGEDGLVIVEGDRRATYLPSVWQKISDPSAFVSGLIAKGSFESPWSNQRATYLYSTRVLSSSP